MRGGGRGGRGLAWLDARPAALGEDATARWLQAQMIARLAREHPAPCLPQALSQPVNPW